MFDDSYKTIANTSKGMLRDRGSRFIAFAFPVNTEEAAKAILAGLKKEYHDATHHCYAYQLGFDKSAYRMNDDGEPSGTAGRPIFGQIQSRDLTNVMVVVIRYFGRTKLGVSGLIHAYKTVAAEALDTAGMVEKVITEVYELRFSYEQMNEVMRALREEKLQQRHHRFEADCSLEFSVRKSFSEGIIQMFNKIKGVKVLYIATE